MPSAKVGSPISDAVAVRVEGYVIVDVDAGTRPFAQVETLRRERTLIAGLSTAANCVALEPSRLRNGRSLIRSRSSRIAWFNSSIEKNFRFRNAAMIHRSARSTPDSTLALSRGLYGR